MDSNTPGKIINKLVPGKFANLGKVTPAGSLEARKLTTGTALYWRVTIGGKTDRMNIGFYDSSAAPKSLKPTARGYSIQAAMRAAEGLAQAHHDNLDGGGYRGLMEAEAEARRLASEVEAEAMRKAAAVKLAAAKYTLQALLSDYCDHLKALGRRSHNDARSIFRIHVTEAWPMIAATPANQVTGEQVADAMRKVMEAGKGRTANKLRSYIRAAYQVALAARSKASVPLHFKDYHVTTNPGADTVPDESANATDKNPLSADELRAYWKIIKPIPGFVGAVLRLHLLTGGQRIEQLVNLKTANVTGDTITLFDGKGRPGKAPRAHTVPLIPLAAAAMLELKPQGTYALSSDIDTPRKNGKPRKNGGGDRHLAATTLSNWAVAAAVNVPGFATKRIRSGVETLLASARISMEHRGRLQSHGISGVQNRSYDGHDYMEEKRHALETLFTLLDAPESTNVVQFRAA